MDAFFAIPDDEIEANLHLQSPWLLRLELELSKVLDSKLEMNYVTGRIAENFRTDLFVIWSEDNAEKVIIAVASLVPWKKTRMVLEQSKRIYSYGSWKRLC